MIRPKMREVFLLALLVLMAVPLAGCHSVDSFPFYLMEECEDYFQVLYVDGIQYQRDLCAGQDELAHYYSDGDQYAWTPAEGIWEQIGVCGEDANKEASLKIYELTGDEEHIFLYTCPAHFYFGGVETRLWMQNGVMLGTPTAEMVSSVTLVSENDDNPLAQVDNPAMIAALLESYTSDSIQVPTGGDWVGGSLIMHHKDFPFLQYEIEYRCSLELEISYCQNADHEWCPLPNQWAAVISGHGLSVYGE